MPFVEFGYLSAYQLLMRLRILSSVLLLTAIVGCSDDPIVPAEREEFDSLHEEFLYRAPRLLAEHRVPGVAIGLIVDGEVVLRKGFGFASIEAERPVTASTVFNVGEISMLFTGWGVGRLVNETLLFDDVPVENLLTQWQFPPSNFDAFETTLARLLRHTGGTSVEHYQGYPIGEQLPTLIQLLNGEASGVEDVRVIYEPGTQTRYSSGGFSVIQLAITEAIGPTDGSFENFMLYSVLRPFGMETSDFRYSPIISTSLATPYDSEEQPEPVRLYRARSASGLMTTLDDLLTFSSLMIAVGEGQPFSLVAGFTRPALQGMVGKASGELPVYENAHQVRSVGNLVTLGHVASINSWQSVIQVDPFRGHAIVVLTNSANGGALNSVLVCRWYEELAGDSPAEFCVNDP